MIGDGFDEDCAVDSSSLYLGQIMKPQVHEGISSGSSAGLLFLMIS